MKTIISILTVLFFAGCAGVTPTTTPVVNPPYQFKHGAELPPPMGCVKGVAC